MPDFKRIGLLGRFHKEQSQLLAKRLLSFLTSKGLSVIVSRELAETLGQVDCESVDESEMGPFCDLAVVIGGDGSMLGAARALVDYQVPLLGINRGRLGFLTDIMPEEAEAKVAEVLSGEFDRESRFMLAMTVQRDGKNIGQGYAMNDVVLHPGRTSHMVHFELYVDDQFVYSQSSDGLIVSTPTGSTAYALSGGGPLMHPSLNAIVLVPLNPHTLSSRPIVVSGDSEIKLVVGAQNRTLLNVTCDGQSYEIARAGDEVLVKQKHQKLTLIHPREHNYYETCRSKLGWGQLLTGKR